MRTHFFKFLQMVFGLLLAISGGLFITVIETPIPILNVMIAIIGLIGFVVGFALFGNAGAHFREILLPEKFREKEASE